MTPAVYARPSWMTAWENGAVDWCNSGLKKCSVVMGARLPAECLRAVRGYQLPTRKVIVAVANMESETRRPEAEEAAHTLNALAEDRRELAAGVRVPWVLLCALGLMPAWMIARFADAKMNEEAPSFDIPRRVLAVLLLVGYLIERHLGIKLKQAGWDALLAGIGLFVVFMLLNTVALGAAAFEVRWVIALACAGAFVLNVAILALSYRAAAQKIVHG